MYFTAQLSIDPSQATRIEQVVPKTIFKQWLLYLASGKITKEEEHETFCAVSILQQFNAVFQALSMDNIIRLSKDEIDYYFDQEGKEGDIAHALQDFRNKVEDTQEDLFNQLFLVLEHETDLLHFYIQIRINRKHNVGEYPIEVLLNAVFKEFTFDNGHQDIETLQNKLFWVMEKQAQYDALVAKHWKAFTLFVQKVRSAIQQFIGVDDIQQKLTKNIIHPRQAITHLNKIPFHREVNLEPIFHGYYGAATKVLYAWLWSEVCFVRKLQIQETFIVNDRGGVLLDLGKQPLPKETIILKAGIDWEGENRHPKPTEDEEISFSFSALWAEMPNAPRSEYSFLENRR